MIYILLLFRKKPPPRLLFMASPLQTKFLYTLKDAEEHYLASEAK